MKSNQREHEKVELENIANELQRFEKKRLGLAVLSHQNTVIVAAGGSSNRMNGKNKQMLKIGGIPVLIHSILALEKSEKIHHIIIVTKFEMIDEIHSLCHEYKISKLYKVIEGGDNRYSSVLNGVLELPIETSYIAVHDGARPFITPKLINDVFTMAENHGAAIPAVPVKDTIKIARSNEITDTPDRRTLFAAQTPQVFELGLYIKALKNSLSMNSETITDDSSLIEAIGEPVYIVDGDYNNIKITTPEDLILAEALYFWAKQTI